MIRYIESRATKEKKRLEKRERDRRRLEAMMQVWNLR